MSSCVNIPSLLLPLRNRRKPRATHPLRGLPAHKQGLLRDWHGHLTVASRKFFPEAFVTGYGQAAKLQKEGDYLEACLQSLRAVIAFLEEYTVSAYFQLLNF